MTKANMILMSSASVLTLFCISLGYYPWTLLIARHENGSSLSLFACSPAWDHHWPTDDSLQCSSSYLLRWGHYLHASRLLSHSGPTDRWLWEARKQAIYLEALENSKEADSIVLRALQRTNKPFAPRLINETKVF